MKNEFILFLKRKRVLTKFKKNMTEDLDSYLDRLIRLKQIDDFVIKAFTWPNGEEHQWILLNEAWYVYLETGKTNK